MSSEPQCRCCNTESRSNSQAFRCENTFKFSNIENKIKSKAPYLLELFQQLASRQRNLMYDIAGKRTAETDDWVDEELLDDTTMDVDEGNMDFGMHTWIQRQIIWTWGFSLGWW